MAAESAGLLAYRAGVSGWQVLLAHPGGPFFKNRDDGAWTIPKGAPEPGEPLVAAACREFHEEIGLEVPAGAELRTLGSVRQGRGKIVHAWAVALDFPEGFVVRSNEFELEWPPRSGRVQRFPEVDRALFFDIPRGLEKILAAQRPLLERLSQHLEGC